MTFTKDPDSTLDYTFDWSGWLEDGETIASQTVTAQDGITKDSISAGPEGITVWVSGGTAGKRYSVACKITTDNTPARVDERTIYIRVVER